MDYGMSGAAARTGMVRKRERNEYREKQEMHRADKKYAKLYDKDVKQIIYSKFVRIRITSMKITVKLLGHQ